MFMFTSILFIVEFSHGYWIEDKDGLGEISGRRGKGRVFWRNVHRCKAGSTVIGEERSREWLFFCHGWLPPSHALIVTSEIFQVWAMQSYLIRLTDQISVVRPLDRVVPKLLLALVRVGPSRISYFDWFGCGTGSGPRHRDCNFLFMRSLKLEAWRLDGWRVEVASHIRSHEPSLDRDFLIMAHGQFPTQKMCRESGAHGSVAGTSGMALVKWSSAIGTLFLFESLSENLRWINFKRP